MPSSRGRAAALAVSTSPMWMAASVSGVFSPTTEMPILTYDCVPASLFPDSDNDLPFNEPDLLIETDAAYVKAPISFGATTPAAFPLLLASPAAAPLDYFSAAHSAPVPLGLSAPLQSPMDEMLNRNTGWAPSSSEASSPVDAAGPSPPPTRGNSPSPGEDAVSPEREKYIRRRKNNNDSACRSRLKRRTAEKMNAERVAVLERERMEMLAKIQSLEGENSYLRSIVATHLEQGGRK